MFSVSSIFVLKSMYNLSNANDFRSVELLKCWNIPFRSPILECIIYVLDQELSMKRVFCVYREKNNQWKLTIKMEWIKKSLLCEHIQYSRDSKYSLWIYDVSHLIFRGWPFNRDSTVLHIASMSLKQWTSLAHAWGHGSTNKHIHITWIQLRSKNQQCEMK